VDAIIQIGSPKGIARFLQRAGRSGHRPDARSKAWYLPTHALEIVEGASIRVAMDEGVMESREPYLQPIDVLSQWMVTLACGEGFVPEELLAEVRGTHAYAELSDEDWQWCLDFITRGGSSLTAYPEFQKVEVVGDRFHIDNGRLALRHRMQIGTITSELSMNVAFMNGKSLGTIEESFISRLEDGDVFLYAGRALELVQVHDMTAFVKPSNTTKGAVARWEGGRMPLSAQMSEVLRRTLHEAAHGVYRTPELRSLKPLLELQAEMSALPKQDELLIERFRSREGYHTFVYPFEGRLAHEGLAALLAYRLAQREPITFSLAMNDYGFELLSDQESAINDHEWRTLLSISNLSGDILNSANTAQLARRKFRDIARIAGLIFQGFPGKQKKARHLQASSSLFFDVFTNYDNTNLLLRQAYDETLAFQLDEARIRSALHRIAEQRIVVNVIQAPSPFSAPLLVDRLREKLGSEKTEDRIRKMVAKAMA
jgi:ATP-dependent Lhr-like helicase